MAEVVRMPEVLAGVTEATIVEWKIREGDTVNAGDVLAEAETDKALVDLPASSDGTVARLLVAQGATVSVGAELLVLLAPGEAPDEDPKASASSDDRAAPAQSEDGHVAGAEEPAPPHQRPAQGSDCEKATTVPCAAPEKPRQASQFSSPLARRLARQHGLAVSDLKGTGPGGRVTRADVEDAVAEGSVSPAPHAPEPDTAPPSRASSGSSGAVSTRPHSPMRRAIARRLTEAKTTIPHFYIRRECRVDALLDLRAQLNEIAEPKVSVNDLVVKAAGVAFSRVPEANVTWSEDGTGEHSSVDICVAVSTGDGLVTPVVRGISTRTVTQISTEVRDLAARARAGRLRQHEIEGGTFTVSNLGMHDVSEFAAIINPPQSAILAVGSAVQRPIVVDGSLAVGTVMTVTLSADHRVIDGELAARWLAAFASAVERPLELLV